MFEQIEGVGCFFGEGLELYNREVITGVEALGGLIYFLAKERET